MKKYTSRATKWLAVLTLVSAMMLAIGLVFIVVGVSDISLQIGLTVFGGLMCILFLGCFLAENSRALIIETDKVIFPRGADVNGKTVFKKTVVNIDEISSVKSEVYKGDKIISKDCFFHTLNLKDNTKVTVTLYAYGEKSEKEILETIEKALRKE